MSYNDWHLYVADSIQGSLINMFGTTMQTALSSIWVVRSVASVILIGTAWAMGYGATLFLQPLEQPNLPEVLVTAKAQVELQSGQASYVMGKQQTVLADKPDAQPVIETENVSKTRLRLELIGIIDLPERGVALIRVAGKTKAVAEGEMIQKGVELLEVHSELVILSHRGKREKLLMKQLDQSLFKEAGKTGSSPRLQTSEVDSLREIRQSIQDNPLSISKFVRFKPIGRSGAWNSIKVWPRSNRELFKGLGFKSGDQILSVNGVSVAELSKRPAAWQTLLSETQFEMVVQRRGKEMPLSIQLD